MITPAKEMTTETTHAEFTIEVKHVEFMKLTADDCEDIAIALASRTLSLYNDMLEDEAGIRRSRAAVNLLAVKYQYADRAHSGDINDDLYRKLSTVMMTVI